MSGSKLLWYSNPVTLGTWSYEQCLRCGVEFEMNTQAVAANLSTENEIVSLANLGRSKTSRAIDLCWPAAPGRRRSSRSYSPDHLSNSTPLFQQANGLFLKTQSWIVRSLRPILMRSLVKSWNSQVGLVFLSYRYFLPACGSSAIRQRTILDPRKPES